MAKKKVDFKDPYERKDYFNYSSHHTINKGDLIKVSGEYGNVFRFESYVYNPKIDKYWVDCVQLFKGIVGPYRSFESDRIKPIKKRSSRVKRNSVS